MKNIGQGEMLEPHLHCLHTRISGVKTSSLNMYLDTIFATHEILGEVIFLNEDMNYNTLRMYSTINHTLLPLTITKLGILTKNMLVNHT